jgi:hypothetical protein
MNGTQNSGFPDCAGWQALLDRQAAGWPRLAPDACIAVLRQSDHAACSGTLLLWRGGTNRVQVEARDYTGTAGADVAVLLVIDDDAVPLLRGDGAAAIASLVRRGRLRPFMLKTMAELEAAGLAEFIEDLGLVFPRH